MLGSSPSIPSNNDKLLVNLNNLSTWKEKKWKSLTDQSPILDTFMFESFLLSIIF